MKSTKSILSGVIILALGIILIICHNRITGNGIIDLAGILFLLTGIINLIMYVTRKEEDGRPKNRGFALFFGWLVSLAAIILGLCMLVFNSTFNEMIPFIFGLLVFFGAVMLTYSLIYGLRRLVTPPAWLWFFPGAMAVMAIIIAVQKAGNSDPLIMLLTGISLIVFGVAGMIMSIILSHARREAERNVTAHTGVVDVAAKELKAGNEK